MVIADEGCGGVRAEGYAKIDSSSEVTKDVVCCVKVTACGTTVVLCEKANHCAQVGAGSAGQPVEATNDGLVLRSDGGAGVTSEIIDVYATLVRCDDRISGEHLGSLKKISGIAGL
jgi:hypothetical protein